MSDQWKQRIVVAVIAAWCGGEAVLGGGVGAAAAAPAPPTSPRPSTALPQRVDTQPGYQPQVSCDPVTKPGTTALGRLLKRHYGGGVVGYSRVCTQGRTEHSDGRALDWMLDAADEPDATIARAALDWLTKNDGEMARRLGVQYLIWDSKIWSTYRSDAGWRPYSGDSPHTDHIHISLTWDGAMARTSWWTGKAVRTPDQGPCRIYVGEFAPVYRGRTTTSCAQPAPSPESGKATYAFGASNPDIKEAQANLGITLDGSFGPQTQSALLRYQGRNGLPRTGALDQETWLSLGD